MRESWFALPETDPPVEAASFRFTIANDFPALDRAKSTDYDVVRIRFRISTDRQALIWGSRPGPLFPVGIRNSVLGHCSFQCGWPESRDQFSSELPPLNGSFPALDFGLPQPRLGTRWRFRLTPYLAVGDGPGLLVRRVICQHHYKGG